MLIQESSNTAAYPFGESKFEFPMHLKDFTKIYENFIDDDLCKTVVKQLETADWQMHTFYDYANNKSVQHDKELDIAYLETEESKATQDKLWYAVNQYLRKDFGFMSEWYGTWSGYSRIRYNRYNVDTRMKLHCDHIHSMFDGERKGIPTLTILGSLNDDYEGGDLILWESEKIELKAGSVIIFPSNFMYPHKVVEVTKGVRYSFVSWVW